MRTKKYVMVITSIIVCLLLKGSDNTGTFFLVFCWGKINKTGKKNMTSHWFSVSQWQLPNEDDYRKLHALLAQPDRAIAF